MSKILIIEDDQVVTNVYRNKLVVEGHNVECCVDGESGLQKATEFEPDVLILDLMLPGINGVEVLKLLRSQPRFEKTPVVVLSNTYLTSLVQEAWKAGATKCLSKASSTPKSVLSVIRGVLHQGAEEAQPGRSGKPSPIARPPSTPFDDEDESDAEQSRSLIDAFPAALAKIRTLHQQLSRAATEEDRMAPCEALYQEIHKLAGSAGLAGIQHLAQMTEALEALVKELRDKPKTINASTLRTLASAIDLLGAMSSHSSRHPGRIGAGAKVLVVDDDAISRRAVSYSLEKARLNSVAVEDPKAAMDLLSNNTYDLVVLDVEMPEVNGYELCSKLRGFAANKNTPVVFVTALNSFESRANSSMSGGNDFIGKPFLFIELGVKALVHIWRSRLAPAKAA